MLQGGNGRLLLQALPKTMNIKIERNNISRLREMLQKNSRYESADKIINEALFSFYLNEKRRRFR